MPSFATQRTPRVSRKAFTWVTTYMEATRLTRRWRSRSICRSCAEIRSGALAALVAHDFAILHNQHDAGQIEHVLQRIPGHHDQVGTLAGLECPQLVALADGGGGIRSHDFEDVARREHQVERSQFIGEALPGIPLRVGAIRIRHAAVPEDTGVYRALTATRERTRHGKRAAIPEDWLIIRVEMGNEHGES